MLWSTGAVLLSVCSTLFWTHPVSSHGLLADPPSRSSMWRLGYPTPVNYQDNELFCGGFAHQVEQGYKCGVCGDPYDGVRDNEEGGKYATGIITRTYHQGQTATFRVNITANHKGYFEFKLCPTNSATVKTTQACLDLYPVQMADGSGTKYQLTPGVAKTFDVQVQLPQDLNCRLCVLQWRYHT
ncbi:uncharacterized protein LOC131929924, partial [Physella acuta]|uniref:uncharacterized protein LOC131929924 n=1 Tax=Physella acuta TaxID=109671 RepID=UPI0027DC156E